MALTPGRIPLPASRRVGRPRPLTSPRPECRLPPTSQRSLSRALQLSRACWAIRSRACSRRASSACSRRCHVSPAQARARACTRPGGRRRASTTATGRSPVAPPRTRARAARSGDCWSGGVSTLACSTTHRNSLEHHFHRLGKPISTRPERIRGALKYHWKEGVSSAPAQSASTPFAPSPRPRSAA
jgi:hypothetical protein